MINTYLHRTQKFLAKLIENGATIIQFEFAWILTEVLSHQVTDHLQFFKITLYFYQVVLRFLNYNK